MRILIQILLLMVFSSEIIACADSYQYRLFPIGLEGQNVIAMETSLKRYWGPDSTGITVDTRTRWKGTISLIQLEKGKKPELIEIIDTMDILDLDYVEELNSYLTIAVQKAERIRDIIFAKEKDMEICNFNLSCGKLSLKKDTLGDLTLIKDALIEHNIDYPNVIIEKSVESGGMINQEFKMISIRTIEIGDFELNLINIASGEEHNTDFNKQEEIIKKHKLIENTTVPEITLYHGLAFDSLIWN